MWQITRQGYVTSDISSIGLSDDDLSGVSDYISEERKEEKNVDKYLCEKKLVTYSRIKWCFYMKVISIFFIHVTVYSVKIIFHLLLVNIK